jgi:PAS domain S-box-containing protein/putative nucleotidyltransferase with HDIG domain
MMEIHNTRMDWRISVLYALFGGLWILLTDRVLAFFVHDIETLTLLQTYKGWVFVLFGTVLIFLLLRRDLRHRQATENQLRESEVRYRQIFENSLDAILLTAPDGSVFAANRAACEMFGRSEEEIMALGRHQLADADDPRLAKGLEERQRSGQFRGALTFYRQDGTKFEGEVTSSVYKTWNGLQYSSVIIRDVTEQKAVQEKIAASEAELRALFLAMQDAVLVIDREGVYREVAPTNPQLLIRPPQELLGRNLSDFFPPEQAESFLATIRQVLETQRKAQIDYTLPVDGGQLWFSTTISPMTADRTLWVARDITDRRRVDEALLKSEQDYRHLFENANDVIIIFEPQHERILAANAAACHVYGFRREELVGKSLKRLTRDVVHGEAQIRAILEQGSLRDFESVHINNHGEEITFLINASLVQYQGQVAILSINHNITERKRAEVKIQTQLDRLTALREIDQAITSAIDMKMSLNVLVTRAISLLKVDAMTILLVNAPLGSLDCAAALGFWAAGISNFTIPIEGSIAGHAIQERIIVQIPDLAADPYNPLHTGFLQDDHFLSYYAAPLIVKGKVIGVMEAFHRSILQRDADWLDFFSTLAGQAAIAIDNARLFESLQISNTELQHAYEATIEGWSRALDLRDKETEGHTLRVTEQTLILARKMGFSDEELVHIRRGALLHDIGKMGVPDHILHKPAALTTDEWEIMRKHPSFAFELLSPIRYLKSTTLDIPYCHHEKWDGSGYPRGLHGEQIPLTARIFAVVDVYDALTSDRPYRPQWTHEKTMEYLLSLSGTHFDPNVLHAFVELLEQGRTGLNAA